MHSCLSTPSELDNLETKQTNNQGKRANSTRSTASNPDDSLTMMSNIQGDFNNLILSRIIKTNDTYVLSLKREDAVFLGVPEELYDSYVDYVEKLNNNETNEL